MARFDVFELADGSGLVLDCQSDILSGLNTRLVVPLVPRAQAPEPAGRLNPVFEIDGAEYVMVTQFAAAIELRELGRRVTSLARCDTEIDNAFDMLLTGY